MRFLPLIVPFLLISLGLFILGGVLHSVYKSHFAKNWPAVSGVIVSSKAEVSSRATTTGSVGVSSVGILYSYSIKRRKYIGSNIGFSFLGQATTKDKVQAQLDMYPAGKPVRVFYNPNDYTESVLLKRSINKFLPSVFGLIAFLFGYFLLKKKLNEINIS